MDFLIKCLDGDWFDLKKSKYPEVLRPVSFPSRTIYGWGDHRIMVNDCQIAFSFEDPGIHVYFEDANFPETDAEKIMNEIAANITQETGQEAYIIPLN